MSRMLRAYTGVTERRGAKFPREPQRVLWRTVEKVWKLFQRVGRGSLESTLCPTLLGHHLAANVAEKTGQGETGHILHQRCVGCDPLQARNVAEGTAFSCCVLLTQPVNKGIQGNLQATFACTVPESRQRKSCSRGTFACPKVAGERIRWYPVHDRNFGVPSMSENRDVSRPGAANRPGTAP